MRGLCLALLASAEECVPRSCFTSQKCGVVLDGCGGETVCGACAAGEDCVGNVCVNPRQSEGCDGIEMFKADDTRGTQYRGCQTETISGRTCQRWDAQVPHTHAFSKEAYPSFGLDGNYCRNPIEFDTIWCYTTDPAVTWEVCSPIGDVEGTRTQLSIAEQQQRAKELEAAAAAAAAGQTTTTTRAPPVVGVRMGESREGSGDAAGPPMEKLVIPVLGCTFAVILLGLGCTLVVMKRKKDQVAPKPVVETDVELSFKHPLSPSRIAAHARANLKAAKAKLQDPNSPLRIVNKYWQSAPPNPETNALRDLL